MTDEELLKYQNDSSNKTSGVMNNDTGVGPSNDAASTMLGPGSATYQPLAAGEYNPNAYHPLQPGEYNWGNYHPLNGTPEGINPATMASPSGVGPSSLPFGGGSANMPTVASPMPSSPVAAPINNMGSNSNSISPSPSMTSSMLSGVNSTNPNKKLLGQFGGY